MKIYQLLTLFIVLTCFIKVPSLAEYIAAHKSIVNKFTINNHQYIKFNIKAIEEEGSSQEIISETNIAGPSGTDFDIHLKDKRFTLDANFITELMDNHLIKVLTTIKTRRSLGLSKQNLPIYEEDLQNHTLSVALDEAIILFPFGQNSEGSNLKIAIEPQIIDLPLLSDNRPAPLIIDLVKVHKDGLININAQKIPHNYLVTAELLANGKAVYQSNAKLFYQAPTELIFTPAVQNSNSAPLASISVLMTINSFVKDCPDNGFTINFDLLQSNINSQLQKPLAKNWSGAGQFGETLTYNLNNILPSKDDHYQLSFKLQQVDK